MSGTPTEVEIITQWKAVVDILETFRAHVDDTHAVANGKWDTLLKALEGSYTPAELADWTNTFRAGCSDLMSQQIASRALTPILFEWAGRIDADATGTQGFGTGKRSVGELFRMLYDWFVAKSYVIESRAITYDTSVTKTGTGDGDLGRLTVDENGFNLEACTVEKKLFRCIADQNSGVEEHAEVFEVIGEASSFDSVLRPSFGSGASANTTIVSRNAGSGAGGSVLTNSSFSQYDSSATNVFSGWTDATAIASTLDQDTVNFYRSHPGSQTDASLEITGGLGTVTLKQTLSAMRVRRLDPDTPYQFRVMVNPTIGTASGGTVTIKCGSNSKDVSIAALSAGWNELILDFDRNLWFREFNEDPFDVEIEWSSSTSGTLLFDDAIFAPLELIDGTYWFLRGNDATHTSWLVDDVLAVTDTGGLPATAKLQYWLMVAGFGYLPSNPTPTGSPDLSDP